MRIMFLTIVAVLLSAIGAYASVMDAGDSSITELMRKPDLLLLSGAVLIGLGIVARKKKRRR